MANEANAADAPVQLKSRTRKEIRTGLDTDPQVAVATRSLKFFEGRASERLEIDFPLSDLKPSMNNPRRLSLDAAGVNAKQISELALRPAESIESWLDRQDEFIKSIPETQFAKRILWEALFELAVNVLANDLIQPIVAQPDGEIIAGERRYTASLLAGKSTTRVILRHVPDNLQHIYRLIENIQRSDLSIAEIVLSVRKVMADLTGKPCSTENTDITPETIQKTLSCKQTQSYYYYAACRLTDGDPLLQQILDGEFSSLRVVYETTNKHLKRLRLDIQSTTPNGHDSSAPGTAGSKQKSERKPAVAQVKCPLPGTNSGKVIITALSQIETLPAETVEQLNTTLSNWEKWPDKIRKAQLAEALTAVVGSLQGLDDDDDGGSK